MVGKAGLGLCKLSLLSDYLFCLHDRLGLKTQKMLKTLPIDSNRMAFGKGKRKKV